MCKYVIKRDGRKVDFDHSKIYHAIQRAFKAAEVVCDYAFCCRIANAIDSSAFESLSVEDIQDRIIDKLKIEYPKVAEVYTAYRKKRDLARRSKIRKVFEDIVNVRVTDVTTENGNMNADTPAGMMYKFASESSKEFVLSDVLSQKFADAHANGDIHIHDLDYYITKSFTCLQHPLDRILKEGFFAGHGESRPAKRIETAAILGCISLECVQNCMHGGQAIPAFDFYLAPYVRRTYQEELDKISKLLGKSLVHLYDVKIKDYIKKELKPYSSVRLTDKRIVQQAINNTVDRVHQAMEAFIHNMNTIHSRGGRMIAA